MTHSLGLIFAAVGMVGLVTYSRKKVLCYAAYYCVSSLIGAVPALCSSDAVPLTIPVLAAIHAQYVALGKVSQICNPFNIQYQTDLQLQDHARCEEQVSQAMQFAMLVTGGFNLYVVWCISSYAHWIKVEGAYWDEVPHAS